MEKERLNIVIVGHVDHGKSTVIGRLLADTGSLPEGKLESVKANCAKNSKPFEYAFLLDALKDEQAQGITIDVARCFFETKKRHYVVIDAPGHIEFLKNMVTGASNAEAALIVIDAKEGIQENTRRHGYLISMLGIKKVVVVVNKMDLIGYDEKQFNDTVQEYTAFLKELNVEPISFIPISAREGENMVEPSKHMPWFQGNTVLAQLDAFEKSSFDEKFDMPFRYPIQDVYKFTESGDDRRLFAGTVESGTIKVGDNVIFWPSQKSSTIQSVERFNKPQTNTAQAGEALGFTLSTQVYVRPGELMVKEGEQQPEVSFRFRANIFWMGKAPLIQGKSYKLKIATKRIQVKLAEVRNVLDASELSTIANKKQVDRHDVGECIFETVKPIAFDLSTENDATGRFVIVDNHEIAGGGIILESMSSSDSIIRDQVAEREKSWVRGAVTHADRAKVFGHNAGVVVFTGNEGVGKRLVAQAVEKRLFEEKVNAYYFATTNLNLGLDSDMLSQFEDRSETIRRTGELSRILTDAGQIFLTSLIVEDGFDLKQFQILNAPNDLIVVNVGENNFSCYKVDLVLDADDASEAAVEQVIQLLRDKNILLK